MDRFETCFAGLADPRSGNAQRHELLDIEVIAFASQAAAVYHLSYK